MLICFLRYDIDLQKIKGEGYKSLGHPYSLVNKWVAVYCWCKSQVC